MSPPTSHPLSFHGGAVGALVPLTLFLAGVAWLGLSGAPDERGFWPVLLAALSLSLALAKDRHIWSETVVRGMSQPLVALMILAWLLAGVLGALLGKSGLVEGLVWLATTLGVSGAGFAVAAFLIACLVSTATGTSLGTVILCAPLLYPAGGALGAHPALLIGAILGGATFGDNVSPVSDTTIASAMTQQADIPGVVRSRFLYALPAAGFTVVVLAMFGDAATTQEAPLAATPLISPAGLPMLLAPLVVLVLLLRRAHLVHGLLVGIAAAAALGLALGRLAPRDLLFIDTARYSARGLLVDGFEKGIGVSIFTLLLMGLVATLEGAGLIDRLIAWAQGKAHSPASAERWIFAAVNAAGLLTTHSTVAILMTGDFTRQLGERFGVSAYRRSNLLDTTMCSWIFLVPWCIPAILAASTTAAGEAYGMPRLSPLTVGMANLHSWGLLMMMLAAVFLGYGREKPARRTSPGAIVALVLLVLPANSATAEDWPAFLGPRGDGKSAERLKLPWPAAGPNVLWWRPVGEGYSAPSVAAGRVFVFDRLGDEARLAAWDAATGRELWRVGYPTRYEDYYGYSGGPRAAPVVDGERVFTYGVEGRLRAHSVADGRLLWDVDTAARFGMVQNFFGVGASPVIEGELLIAQVGGSPPASPPISSGEVRGNGSGIVAFDKASGAVRYQLSDELASYSTPRLATLGGRRWAFAFTRGGLLAFEPKAGKLDFFFPWRAKKLESVNAASPVVVEDLVLVSESYGPGSALLRVKPGGYEPVWKDPPRDQSLRQHWSTPIVHQGTLYASSGQSSGEAELRAVELATGKVLWREKGLGRSTLTYADGHLLVLTETGRLLLVRATPARFEQVAELDLSASSATNNAEAKKPLTATDERPRLRFPAWNAPVLANGRLYLRGRDQLICLEVGK